MSSRSVRAPVGQWVMHWPHRAHFAASMDRPSFTPTERCPAEPEKSHTEQCWTLEHSATQRRQLTHLLASRCRGKLPSHASRR